MNTVPKISTPIPDPIPEMLREELFHPFLAHLPITLIPLATLLLLGALLLGRRASWSFLRPSARLILFFAVVAAWLATYTGDIAEGVVNRVICDPTVTHEHQQFAEWTTYLMSGLAIVEVISMVVARLPSLRKAFDLAVLVGLFVATGMLVRAAHLGASLVYQQGAAVYHPTLECREFE